LCIWIESSRHSIRFLHCFSLADCTNLRTDWVLFLSPSCIMLIYLVAFLMVSSLVPRCESHLLNLYLAFVRICKSALIEVVVS
jgi:chromate transport protein ChrA